MGIADALGARPTRARFLELARTHGVVPLVAELTSDSVTPFTVWSQLAAAGRNPFVLESVEGGERVARFSFAGVDPWRVLELRDGRLMVDGVHQAGDPVDGLRRLTSWGTVAPVADRPPFAGGAVGYLGYDAVRLVERIPARARDEEGLPEGWFGLYDGVVAIDRARQVLQLVASPPVAGDPEGAWVRAELRLEALYRAVAGARSAPTPEPLPRPAEDAWAGWSGVPDEAAFLTAVAQAREHILAGDIFQVVLSRRFRHLPRCTAAEIYRMLRITNPSPYMFLFDTGHARILGASPEMLVRVRDGVVSTCPIAGTRPRGADPEEDLRLEAELRADPKERAEHVMLVDLGRNDIGRVSRSGTVRVVREMAVERYSHVMHLVSEVSGELRPEVDAWEALLRCFPAGTLSGAPKVRAMELIDELEPLRRGVYGGAVAYRDVGGTMDSCIAIRTMVERGGVIQVQAGAGVVYDSVPENELAECSNKARAVIQAVAMAEAAAAGRAPRPEDGPPAV